MCPCVQEILLKDPLDRKLIVACEQIGKKVTSSVKTIVGPLDD